MSDKMRRRMKNAKHNGKIETFSDEEQPRETN